MADRTEQFVFYNLDNNRNPDQVSSEIYALLNQDAALADRPAALVMCEALGYGIGDRKGFTTVRSTANKSRKNIAAYVRNDLYADSVAWHDLTMTWSRTNPGASGQHEARSYPSFVIGSGIYVIALHQPPKNADTCPACQQEGIDLLEKYLDIPKNPSDYQKTRPRLAIGDYNRRKEESGPGPSMLASRTGGSVGGAKIDAVVRNGSGKIQNLTYPTKVNGVTLKSDHGHALSFDLTCDAKWYTK